MNMGMQTTFFHCTLDLRVIYRRSLHWGNGTGSLAIDSRCALATFLSSSPTAKESPLLRTRRLQVQLFHLAAYIDLRFRTTFAFLWLAFLSLDGCPSVVATAALFSSVLCSADYRLLEAVADEYIFLSFQWLAKVQTSLKGFLDSKF